MSDPNGFPSVEPAADEQILQQQRRLQAGANLRALLDGIDIERVPEALRQSRQDGTGDAMNTFADDMKRHNKYE